MSSIAVIVISSSDEETVDVSTHFEPAIPGVAALESGEAKIPAAAETALAMLDAIATPENVVGEPQFR